MDAFKSLNSYSPWDAATRWHTGKVMAETGRGSKQVMDTPTQQSHANIEQGVLYGSRSDQDGSGRTIQDRVVISDVNTGTVESLTYKPDLRLMKHCFTPKNGQESCRSHTL